MPVIINGTSGITDVDGTASAPALTGTDTDTGIFFPAANTMAFSTAGTERMRVDSSGNLQFNSGYGSTATAYGCRAWVNFNGTGTVAIRASGNVTSITDNGVGDYTVNFTNAMPDANYSTVTGYGSIASGATTYSMGVESQTASTVRVLSQRGDGVDVDSANNNVAIFR